MANNNFVVNAAQFTPLSFDDYVKPLAMLNEQHQKLDDAYLELYTKASTVEQMANEQTDPEAYKQYKNYANDLRSAIDVLDKNGLTPNSRRQMLLMARRYGDEVAPIQTAYGRRAQDIMAQREALAKDQSIRFSRKASDSSLMDYMNNPALSYEQMSGAAITADVASKVKNLKNQILKGGVGSWSKTLGGQQFERMIRSGLTTDDIADIMANPTKYPEFMNLINSAVSASGVTDWGTQEDLAYAFQQAYNGLWEGIGTSKIDTVENKDLDRALKYEQLLAARDRRLNPEKYSTSGSGKNKDSEDLVNRAYTVSHQTYTNAKESERVKNRNSDLEFLSKIKNNNLKPKDRERLDRIAQTYGVDIDEKEDGTIDVTELQNAVTRLDKERFNPYYISNLTNSSTILSNIERDIISGINKDEISDKDMDLIFSTTKKKWSDIKTKKVNGVERSKLDILTDIMNNKNSKVAVDPATGRLIVQQTAMTDLGDIVLYDLERDGSAPRILGNQVFGMTYNGITRPYMLAPTESQSRKGVMPIMQELYDLTNKSWQYEDNRAYTDYYNALLQTLFGGVASVNNAITLSHSDSDKSANVVIPID